MGYVPFLKPQEAETPPVLEAGRGGFWSHFSTMQRRLLAVSLAVLAPVQGQAFVATGTGSSGARSRNFPSRTALASGTSPPQSQRPITMAAAAIVGGGRIGCALYVSVGLRVSTEPRDPLRAIIAVLAQKRVVCIIMCHDLQIFCALVLRTCGGSMYMRCSER